MAPHVVDNDETYHDD